MYVRGSIDYKHKKLMYLIGPYFFLDIVRKQLKLEGFAVYEHFNQFPSMARTMYNWVSEVR